MTKNKLNGQKKPAGRKVYRLGYVPELRPVASRFYFAYGSNLNIKAMQERTPGAVKVCGLRLPGYRLVFRQVADIERTGDANDYVEGGLWRISPRDELALDRYEGFRADDPKRSYYLKTTFAIAAKGEVHDVMVYQMAERFRDSIMPPSDFYFRTIVQGYKDFGLKLARLDEALQRAWGEKKRTPLMDERYERKGKPPLARPKGQLILPDDVLAAQAEKQLAEAAEQAEAVAAARDQAAEFNDPLPADLQPREPKPTEG